MWVESNGPSQRQPFRVMRTLVRRGWFSKANDRSIWGYELRLRSARKIGAGVTVYGTLDRYKGLFKLMRCCVDVVNILWVFWYFGKIRSDFYALYYLFNIKSNKLIQIFTRYQRFLYYKFLSYVCFLKLSIFLKNCCIYMNEKQYHCVM